MLTTILAFILTVALSVIFDLGFLSTFVLGFGISYALSFIAYWYSRRQARNAFLKRGACYE